VTRIGSIFTIFVTLAGGSTAVAAQEAEPASAHAKWNAVDKLFAQWDNWKSPGASLAVVRDGEVLYTRGYGNAHLEYPVPITPSTIFHIASISKQFTCFAAVLLAQDGKLSLDDDIRKHLPEVPNFGRTITIRHLMHHTSGLRDQWELLVLAGWRMDDVITLEHIMRMVARQRELNFDPGSEHLYCNTGYTLLAEIVARVSGQSFPEFTEQRIFKPLGMSRTHFHDDHQLIVPGRAYSYAPNGDGFRKSVLSYANAGATSLFTTAEDMARWLVNLDDHRVGGAAAVEQLHQRGKLTDGKQINYALGLSHSKHRGLQLVGHGGADAGFRTSAVRVPEHKLGVVVLSNLASFNPGRLARQVVDIVLSEHLEPVAEDAEGADDSAEPVDVEPAVLDRYVGRYRLDTGMTVTLTRQGGRLISQLEELDPAELVARSQSEFFHKQLGARVVFEDNGDEPATAFAAHVDGQTIRGTRMQTAEAEQLDEFVGVYDSPELHTTYTLLLEDGQLIARHQRRPDIEFTFIGDDEFSGSEWFFGKVKFERQAEQVIGFRVTGGRVRNLHFQRRAASP